MELSFSLSGKFSKSEVTHTVNLWFCKLIILDAKGKE